MNICICLKHKDSKILYSSTHLSEGFLFSSATWKDIAKKANEPFFSQAHFLIHLIQNCPKMKTENSGWSFKIVYHQWDWSPLWSGIVCYLRISRHWKENYGKNVYHKNQNMWIIGTEMESFFFARITPVWGFRDYSGISTSGSTRI